MSKHIAVIGAGMVGVSTGLALLKRGFTVTVVDRKEPGQETSYGNAGIVSRYSVFPLNDPSLWKSLPAYLGNTHPALQYRPGYVAANLSWFMRFLAGATAAGTEPRAKALDGLLAASSALHRAWIGEAGAARRLRETGWLKLWRKEDGRAKAEADSEMLAGFGLDAPVLNRQEISGLEPDIAPIFSVGLFHKDSASVDSPGQVTSAYAALLASRGGMIRKEECRGLVQRQDGSWQVQFSSGVLAVDGVVIALGPWSADALRPLGYRVPLAFERGYHQEFRPAEGRRISRPLYDSDNAYVMTPVENGIRITTGVELTDRDAPSNLGQRDAALPHAREILPFGEPVAEPWRGARPTLPDCLPMIGAAPRHGNLWLGFGHQHIGFTTGPGTGEALASLIAGEPPPFDLAAFRPERYI